MADEQVKIAMTGDNDYVETLWADVLGDDLYVLDNLPWYAYNVSLGDVVKARPDERGTLRLERVDRKSGNRTVRVILQVVATGGELTSESERLLGALRARGCRYEGANKLFVAVNIPPSVELAEVVALLTDSGLDWEYADPTYDDLFPNGDDETSPPEG